MKKLIPFVIAAGLALGGCASGGDTSSSATASGNMSSAKDATSAIMAAEQELTKAAAAGNEWRDTGSIIAKAKAAEKAGKFDDAVKLAGVAKRQSENALAQAEAQKNAGPRM
jgi:hypothetical protein